MSKKKFSLEEFKKSLSLSEVPFKKDKLIPINDALKAVSGLEGLPLGNVYQIYGPSNGGKSSLAYHLAAQSQKVEVLPILINTEGKLSLPRMEAMGISLENCIIENATYVENIFSNIDKYLLMQADGRLPMDILFIVDSVGNTISESSVKISKDGTTEIGGAMMKVSKLLREKMRIFNHKINDTRRINNPHYAGLVFINHSYTQPPAFPGGPSTDVAYGGSGIYYGASLVIKVKKQKQLKTIKDGVNISFGIVSKLSVEKNHLNGISNSGEFIIVEDGIIPNDPAALKDYKESHKDKWNIMSTDDGEVIDE